MGPGVKVDPATLSAPRRPRLRASARADRAAEIGRRRRARMAERPAGVRQSSCPRLQAPGCRLNRRSACIRRERRPERFSGSNLCGPFAAPVPCAGWGTGRQASFVGRRWSGGKSNRRSQSGWPPTGERQWIERKNANSSRG